MADDVKQLKAEIERLKAENQELKQQLDYTHGQFVRLMSHNLDLAERLEDDMEMRRRVDVAIEMMNGNVERMQNADLRDDAQLMAIIELKVEKEELHLDPDFDAEALAKLVGVSVSRLNTLFRHQTLHRTPEAFLDLVARQAQLQHCLHCRGCWIQYPHHAAPHGRSHRYVSRRIPRPLHPRSEEIVLGCHRTGGQTYDERAKKKLPVRGSSFV